MNNVFVYCEVEGTTVAEVSQELLTKGRKLANQQGVELHAIVAGTGIKGQVAYLYFITSFTLHGRHGAALPFTVITKGNGASTVSTPPSMRRRIVALPSSTLRISSA